VGNLVENHKDQDYNSHQAHVVRVFGKFQLELSPQIQHLINSNTSNSLVLENLDESQNGIHYRPNSNFANTSS
jgi:hypothetical protein